MLDSSEADEQAAILTQAEMRPQPRFPAVGSVAKRHYLHLIWRLRVPASGALNRIPLSAAGQQRASDKRIDPVVTLKFPMKARLLLIDAKRRTLTGRTVASRGVIATALKSKRRSPVAPTTLHRTPAPSSSTRASMASVSRLCRQSAMWSPFFLTHLKTGISA